MIDLHKLRADPLYFSKAWQDRNLVIDVKAILDHDVKHRESLRQLELLRAEVKTNSSQFSQKLPILEATKILERGRQLKEDIRAKEVECARHQANFLEELKQLPNPCNNDVPIGKDSSENKPLYYTIVKPPEFEYKPHWDIGPALGIIDFPRATKLSGEGFVVLNGLGAKLSRSLINYFLDTHTANGYEEVAVPYLVKQEAMYGTGQFPKFRNQAYECVNTGLYLIPTAEVPVTNLHSNEILPLEQLPKKYVSHTPCFRSEAGAAGIGTRGMTRVHQFDKVELVWLTKPEDSEQGLLTLRQHAEDLLTALELPYRVLNLCTGDTGFSSAHTYDLEVWSPGTKSWLEVSSCSTFTDFQARRANIKYRDENGKAQFVHTLNGSALALPRCLIALLENHQQPDGSIKLPKVLHEYMGTTVIDKSKT